MTQSAREQHEGLSRESNKATAKTAVATALNAGG